MSQPIVINGVSLSEAQALTLRMALAVFRLDLNQAMVASMATHICNRPIDDHLVTLDELDELIGDLAT